MMVLNRLTGECDGENELSVMKDRLSKKLSCPGLDVADGPADISGGFSEDGLLEDDCKVTLLLLGAVRFSFSR